MAPTPSFAEEKMTEMEVDEPPLVDEAKKNKVLDNTDSEDEDDDYVPEAKSKKKQKPEHAKQNKRKREEDKGRQCR